MGHLVGHFANYWVTFTNYWVTTLGQSWSGGCTYRRNYYVNGETLAMKKYLKIWNKKGLCFAASPSRDFEIDAEPLALIQSDIIHHSDPYQVGLKLVEGMSDISGIRRCQPFKSKLNNRDLHDAISGVDFEVSSKLLVETLKKLDKVIESLDKAISARSERVVEALKPVNIVPVSSSFLKWAESQ